MDSKCVQHHDDVFVSATEEVSAATATTATPAPVLALTPPVGMNQHPLVREDRGIVPYSLEAAFQEYKYKHRVSDCLELRYNNGGTYLVLAYYLS